MGESSASAQQLLSSSVDGAEAAPAILCDTLKEELRLCLLRSDCVRRERRTPLECMKSTDDSVPEECTILRQAYFQCRHELMSTRNRFRGKKFSEKY